MRTPTLVTVGLATALTATACSEPAETLQATAAALGVAELQSLEFSGSGKWYQFGQAPSPTLPWPQFDVERYTATVNYATPAARVQMTRLQTIEPGRVRPVPVTQRPDQYVSGASAWNMAVPAGSPAGSAPVAQPQPAAVEERTMEIWSTPHGFIKAALANNATSTAANGGSEVSFTIGGKYKYVGTLNAQNQVERVRTWIDNAVLGDTLVETTFSDYRDFGGVKFPGRIVRTQGGHPVLDITVAQVTANPASAGAFAVPEAVVAFKPPVVNVEVEKLAAGVYYLRGGSHHSLAIDQADHVVVVEGPQSEERAVAVIAKVKETIPNKPIRYVVNSHVHFDHSSGLRPFVDEGATVVTHALNRPYYEQAWAAPRTLNPDRLAKSGKRATFETFTDKHVLTDGKRTIELYEIAGNGHNDAFLMVFLPAEGILSQVDAWAPLAPNAPPPAAPSPFAVNLYENVQRLKLPVKQIAALHGPGVATLADLRAAVTPRTPTN
jgi:glyoxylase-like metal-dependent hydrolase (beta-lactamase superfamily II)